MPARLSLESGKNILKVLTHFLYSCNHAEQTKTLVPQNQFKTLTLLICCGQKKKNQLLSSHITTLKTFLFKFIQKQSIVISTALPVLSQECY